MDDIKATASSAASSASSTLQNLTSTSSASSNTNPMNEFYQANTDGNSAPASSKGGQPGAPQDETMAKQLKGSQEPVSGKKGAGTTEDPYDRGNEDEVRDVDKRLGGTA